MKVTACRDNDNYDYPRGLICAAQRGEGRSSGYIIMIFWQNNSRSKYYHLLSPLYQARTPARVTPAAPWSPRPPSTRILWTSATPGLASSASGWAAPRRSVVSSAVMLYTIYWILRREPGLPRRLHPRQLLPGLGGRHLRPQGGLQPGGRPRQLEHGLPGRGQPQGLRRPQGQVIASNHLDTYLLRL